MIAPVTYAADSAVYRDPETGFLFSSFNAAFTLGNYITFRVAIPSNVSQNQPYDAVVQISGPLNTGWAGLAWGGTSKLNSEEIYFLSLRFTRMFETFEE